MKKKRNNKKLIPDTKFGFTLIELLVTIFLVSVGLIGVMAFFNASLESQFDAKNEVIAAGLAQEGVELVRNIRDYNILAGNNWYALDLAGGYNWCRRIDRRSLNKTFALGIYFHKCWSNILWDDDVYFDSATGRYTNRFFLQPVPGTARNTGFKRTISVAANGDLDSGGYLEVTCTVTWDNGSRETEAKDRLYSNQF